MKNDYQLGSDDDWLKHSNDELAQMVKKKDRKIQWLRLLSFLLFAGFAWVVYKFSQKGAIEELWRF